MTSTAASLVQPLNEADFGPAMRALPTDKQRAFVLALVNQGSTDYTAAARAAGYGGKYQPGVRNIAWRLSHDDKIQAAIREMAIRRLQGASVVAAQTLLDCMKDPDRRIALKASGMVLDRVGIGPQTEHKVTVEREFAPGEALREIHEQLARAGMDLEMRRKFLKAAGVQDMEFEELERKTPLTIEHRPALSRKAA